jgi:hypothetical protein
MGDDRAIAPFELPKGTTKRNAVVALSVTALLGALVAVAIVGGTWERDPGSERGTRTPAAQSLKPNVALAAPAAPGTAAWPAAFESGAAGAGAPLLQYEPAKEGDVESAAIEESDEADEETPAAEVTFDGKDFVVAAFDLNDDSRLDLIIFEKEAMQVGQILLGGEKGAFTEPTTEVKVPEYLSRYLRMAAEKGAPEGPVELRTDDGKVREVVLLENERPGSDPDGGDERPREDRGE